MKKKLFIVLYNVCFIFLMYKCIILFFQFTIEHGFFDIRVLFVCLMGLYVSEFHTK